MTCELARLIDEGVSVYKACKTVGISPSNAPDWCYAEAPGITIRRSAGQARRYNQALALGKQGRLTVREIAEQTGLCEATVERTLKREGIYRRDAYPAYVRSEIARLRADNPKVTQSEVSRRLNIHRTTIRKYWT